MSLFENEENKVFYEISKNNNNIISRHEVYGPNNIRQKEQFFE